MRLVATIPLTGAALVTVLLLGASAQDKGAWKVLFDGQLHQTPSGATARRLPGGLLDDRGRDAEDGGGRRRGPCDSSPASPTATSSSSSSTSSPAGGNSGVLYRVAEVPGDAGLALGSGDADPGRRQYSDSSPQELDGRPLRHDRGAADKAVRPVGEWNKVRVVVKDNHVEHWLNGKKVVEYDLGSEAPEDLVAGSKFKDMPDFAREPEGYIALQHHDGGDVWFRNVRVPSLSSPCPTVRSRPGGRQAHGGRGKSWVTLFNGKDLTSKSAAAGAVAVAPGKVHRRAVTKEYGHRPPAALSRFRAQSASRQRTGTAALIYHSSRWTAWTSRGCRSKSIRISGCTRAASTRARAGDG